MFEGQIIEILNWGFGFGRFSNTIFELILKGFGELKTQFRYVLTEKWHQGCKWFGPTSQPPLSEMIVLRMKVGR